MKFVPIEQTLGSGVTIRGVQTVQRGLPLMVFLHGNGFAGGVYLPMFKLLAPQLDVVAFDITGHGISDTVIPFAGWNAVAETMHQALEETDLLHNRAVYGVGHSLGAVLTLLSAFRHPNVYRSIVLLDPILFPRRMLYVLKALNSLHLTSFFHPHIRSTRRRRNHWLNREAAYTYFKDRGVYKHWTSEALTSFTQYALSDDPAGGVRLSCDPEIEATFYGTMPRHLWRTIDGIQTPTKLVMADRGYLFAQRAALTAQRRNQVIMQKVIAGGHCFMQEDPQLAATEILQHVQ